MNKLTEALQEVRNKIARYKGRALNEENTKTALIHPVLRALGWHVGNLEAVQQEYRPSPRHKPVDYALLLLRTPKLLVEAKALDHNLGDWKWTGQIMGYATVAGVQWVVITNGDEYRIYNAHAPVPVEQKLFRSVRITDEHSRPEETLMLLSKEAMQEEEIEIRWKAHFVDRQVHDALKGLFAATPDPDESLVGLVKKRVTGLPRKEIRASLKRVQVTFDFPVKPEPLIPDVDKVRSAAARKAWQTRRRSTAGGDERTEAVGGSQTGEHPRQRTCLRVSLKNLIDAGLLRPPVKLVRHYKGRDLEAELLSE